MKGRVKTHIHIPLEMMKIIVSESTYALNEFKTYLSFSLHTSGNCKLTNEFLNKISNHLGISQRTLKKHIKTLIEKKYFGYNPKTNVIFVNGLKKVRRLFYLTHCNEHILSRTSFVLNVSEINELKFLTFTATEKQILKYQKGYKFNLKLQDYLISNNYCQRYENGSKAEKKRLEKLCRLEKSTKRDTIKKDYPNHLSVNFFEDDRDYLGVSNSFVSDKFNRTKSWGSKMKKKSSELDLLSYNKKYRFVQTFPLTFNVKKYISLVQPERYNCFFVKKENGALNLYENGYDEIIPKISLTRRKK